MGVGAAIIGSAVLGAGTSVYAGKQQADAAKAGLHAAQGQYTQTRADLAPWRDVGSKAMYELGALSGLPADYPEQAPQAEPTQTEDSQRGWSNPLYDFDTTARDLGRNGDTEMAHVTPGEVVVPQQIAQQPEVRNRLYGAFQREGLDPSRYQVGGRNSINPLTGRREFFAEDDRGGWREDDYGRGGNPRDMGQEGNRGPGRFFGPQPAPVDQTNLPPEGYYGQDEAIDRFYQSPEYRVPFDEGVRSLDASAASQGGLFSGNQMSAITRYGQDYAANQYNNYWNHLMGLSSSGQNAAAQTGNFAPNYGPYYGSQGQAYGQMGVGINNAIQGGIGNYLYYQGVK